MCQMNLKNQRTILRELVVIRTLLQKPKEDEEQEQEQINVIKNLPCKDEKEFLNFENQCKSDAKLEKYLVSIRFKKTKYTF